MREKFFKIGSLISSIVIFLAIIFSFSFYLIAPFYQSNRKKDFIEVAGFGSLLENQPKKLNFEMSVQDEFLKSNEVQDVWVIKHSSKKATVFSPICPHLGCRYNWDSNANEFICPCHLSIFSKTGRVLSGPAPRPLDTLPYEIKDGKLYVKWEMFKPGLAKKVEIASYPIREHGKKKSNLIIGAIND